MKHFISPCLLLGILIIIMMTNSGTAQINGPECPPPCCGGGSSDWATVTLISMEPRVPVGGWIVLSIEQFATAEDGCDQPIEFAIKRNCWTEIAGLLHGSGKSGMCAVICGNPSDCPFDQVCTGCPGLFNHSCGFFTVRHPLWGKGTFQVFHKGLLIFSQEFDYSDPSVPGEMTFTNIYFLNKDYTEIYYNDIFDGMESVALEVVAEFTGEQPQQGIGVVLKSTLSVDSILISLPLLTYAENVALYSGILHEGTFIPLLGDSELPPYEEGEIIARPVAENCDGSDNGDVPEARLSVANFVLWVQEISFGGDYQLCKDGPASQPGTIELIEDPIWIKDTKNEPVAQRRNTRPDMNVVVSCNRTPYHDFQYWIKGGAAENQRNYSTSIYEGNFNSSSLDTVFSITFEYGNFPDAVGIIDALEYWWYANKAINYDPMYYILLNRSEHKIFLTYEAPPFSPVNILALNKICKYAQNLNEPKAIAKVGVDSVYGEGWVYSPGDSIAPDPLDVLRHTRGQCGDYANLLTYLYNSIGLPANSVVIFNGATFGPYNYVLLWHLTGRPPNELGVLLSESLESCDGQINEWYFTYHAASFAANYLCDAVLGQFRSTSNYSGYWKYYLHPKNPNPPYSHVEPPGPEPSYYHWNLYLPPGPQNILPGYLGFNSGFDHPGP